MQGLQTEHQDGRGVGSVPDVEQIHVFEALEDPAHRRAIGRFLHLAGDRLSSGRELLAQTMLGQAVDEQTEHHDEAEGDDPFRFFHKDGGRQKQRILEKTEPALDTVLFFVRLNEFLVGELLLVEHIGGDEKGRFALHFARDRR